MSIRKFFAWIWEALCDQDTDPLGGVWIVQIRYLSDRPDEEVTIDDALDREDAIRLTREWAGEPIEILGAREG